MSREYSLSSVLSGIKTHVNGQLEGQLVTIFIFILRTAKKRSQHKKKTKAHREWHCLKNRKYQIAVSVARSTQVYIELMEATALILSAYQRRRHLYMHARPSPPLRHPFATLPPGACPAEPFSYLCVAEPSATPV